MGWEQQEIVISSSADLFCLFLLQAEEKLSERGRPGPWSGDRVRRVRPLTAQAGMSVGSAASGLFWRA
ncbi:uncharacterized protein TrAtP1_012793 [Trichoderma atroviride]|uniref:uncharacterized protein n=1 Tax=Hypocrea atroviridis TaxID=63577 RepID=UPI00332524B0|nr:hypothetical protein TrAtP1_012793 [Trichoderma atroviride]